MNRLHSITLFGIFVAGIISEDAHDFMFLTILGVKHCKNRLEVSDPEIMIRSPTHTCDGDVLVTHADFFHLSTCKALVSSPIDEGWSKPFLKDEHLPGTGNRYVTVIDVVAAIVAVFTLALAPRS